ncbi:MAG: sensor histidine kinase [Lachnospiraceae bacterium]|nr:sensor histidine kinase [Lachnospiraceae bacterium]
MTKLTHSLGAKISAIVLWCVAMLGGIGGTLAIIALESMGFYDGDSNIYWQFGYEVAGNYFSYYPWGEYPGLPYEPIYPKFFDFCYAFCDVLIVVTIVSAIAAIFLLIFLMCSAGRQMGEKEAVRNGIDKIPLDIFAAVMAFVVFVLLHVTEETFWLAGPMGCVVLACVWVIIYSLLLLWCLMTLATRFKTGTLWTNSIIYIVLRFVCRVIASVWHGLVDICRNIPILWKTILLIVMVSFVEIFIMAQIWYVEQLLPFWIIEKVIMIPVVLLAVVYMKRLQAGGKKLAEGELDYHVDTRRMYWDFKKHGENLNSISEGMAKAVDEKMKSERFKTELITNVSHDIKTPLTSIINYVDLIKKEEPESETMAEYIDVLDRQSKRLKKLIEDLVEASKASTGNIQVDMQPTSVGVVLTQAAGEYEDRMNEKQLEMILNQPQDDIYIMADGRLLWRVFDNLLSNICKYAQSGTRVYLNLDKISDKAVITFRNISAYPLNMTSEELMERFTRGDSSRHTEGSGLGLSIAKSLTDLQKGDMDIYTDGDLFKVVLTFGQIDGGMV